jgi:hypothetical protein
MPSNLLRDEAQDGRVTHTSCLSLATPNNKVGAAINDGGYTTPKKTRGMWLEGETQLSCFLL